MPREERSVLFLETPHAVVLRLTGDVTTGRFNLRRADAEGAIAVLPREAPQVTEGSAYPVGRSALDY